MSALDQSLDEIISAKPKRQFKKKANLGSKAKVGKTAVTKKAIKPVKASVASKASNNVLDASHATKVIVYGLPKDIKPDAIKDFFASQVGGVQSIALSYNEKGQSKGIATVIFKSSSNATKAVEKYNGAPIDNGKSKLKLELIVDPTKKPLASRILANAVKAKKTSSTSPKPATSTKKTEAKKAKTAKPKSKKPAKKTIEQLDQEMADYFEKN